MAQNDVQAFYERYWQRQGGSPADFDFAPFQRRSKLQRALDAIPAGANVLDAGCGNGDFSLFLNELGYHVSGVDISATAVARARICAPECHFEVASLERGLPFANSIFTAVWCTEVFEHLFDIHAALSELNRVLVYDGLLVFTTPYHGLIKNLAISALGFERHFDPYLSHIRFFTRKSLAMCLNNTGFLPVAWSGVGRRWPLWMSHFVVARKVASPDAAPEIRG